MEYDFMKARKGDVFERWHDNKIKRYVIIDYTEKVVRAVCLDVVKIHNNHVSLKNFSYAELNNNDYVLGNIR